jgi:two-component system, LytTR family, sensor kinase
MKKDVVVPPWSWILAAATILALSSTAQAYRVNALGLRAPHSIPVGRLLALNFTLWWVPAAMTPTIFRFVDWLSRKSSWALSIAYHAAGVALFSIIQFFTLFFVYATFWWMQGRFATIPWVSTAQTYYLDNLNWALVTYGSIAALAYAFNLRRRNHQRALQVAQLETDLVEARLGALAGELQPEFLYGALNTVSNLVHTNPDRADRVISKLGDFLRLVLNRTGSIVGPLQDELECVERYLEIEQIRTGPGLSVRLEIDPDTLDAEFPPMTLHSLVELLLERPSGEPQPSTTALTIESSHHDGSLSVRISRSIEGTAPSQIAQSSRAGRLAAIRDRLRDLYGDKNDVGLNLDERSSAISISVPFRTVLVTE